MISYSEKNHICNNQGRWPTTACNTNFKKFIQKWKIFSFLRNGLGVECTCRFVIHFKVFFTCSGHCKRLKKRLENCIVFYKRTARFIPYWNSNQKQKRSEMSPCAKCTWTHLTVSLLIYSFAGRRTANHTWRLLTPTQFLHPLQPPNPVSDPNKKAPNEVFGNPFSYVLLRACHQL